MFGLSFLKLRLGCLFTFLLKLIKIFFFNTKPINNLAIYCVYIYLSFKQTVAFFFSLSIVKINIITQ